MDLVNSFKKNIGNSSIFQFFKDQDRFLYHYTSAKIAIEYVLKDKQLKLGRYIYTNDPKETKTWQFSLGTNEKRDLSGYSLEEMSERFTQALKHRTNLACFSQDGTLTGDHTRDIYARGFGKSRMWAQYADNHKGVCLILEKSAIRKAVESQFGDDRFRVYGGPVIYQDRLITEVNKPAHGFVIDVDYLEKLGFDEYTRAHVKTHHKNLFFEKVTDWSSEKEFRVVVFGEKEETLYLNIDGTIAGVVFGTDCTEEDISRAVAACDAEKTQFEQIVWKNCTPWYSFSRLEWIPKKR